MRALAHKVRSLLFLAAPIALSLVFSTIPVRADAWDNVVAAIDASNAGKYQQAVKLVTSAINSKELTAIQSARALLTRGEAYQLQGKSAEARTDLTRAIEASDRLIRSGRLSGEHLAWPFNTRGLANQDLGREAEALADYAAAVKAAPNFWRSYLNRANIYLGHRRLDLAIADYDAALMANPQHAGLYYSRARVKIYLGDYTGAIADCDRGLAIDPTSAHRWRVLFGRGNANLLKGDVQQAIADYEYGLALNPDDRLAKRNLERARKALQAGGTSLDAPEDALWERLASPIKAPEARR